jgi:hypothetical protein
VSDISYQRDASRVHAALKALVDIRAALKSRDHSNDRALLRRADRHLTFLLDWWGIDPDGDPDANRRHIAEMTIWDDWDEDVEQRAR